MMRFGTGTYNVRDSEGLNPDTLIKPSSSSLQRTISCRVFLLDGSEHSFSLPRQSRGGELLDKVFEYLELIERDFFGLQFVSILDPGEDTQQKKWLDPNKSIRKQMICPPYNLYFRVKFYVSDPSKLVEEYTRYHVFMQLRKDIADGRLPVGENSLVLLASYAVQSEFGDYSPEEHGDAYLDGLTFSADQPDDFAERVAALHTQHTGMCPADAEYAFIEHAKRLDLYGVELFECKDVIDATLAVGANAFGMLIFTPEHQPGRGRIPDLTPSKLRKISEFPWSCIMKISFKRKQFYVEIRSLDDAGSEKDTVLHFHCLSSPACKALWKSCVEHHTFFRLIAPPIKPQKGLFNLGSRFRYSGRTEFQTMEDVKRRARVDRPFVRSSSKNSFARHTYGGGSGATTHRSTDSSRISDNESPERSARIYSRSHSWARRLLFAQNASSVGGRRSRSAAATGRPLAAERPPLAATEDILAGHEPMIDARTVADVEADCEVVLALHKSTSLPSEKIESESSAPSLQRRSHIETSYGVPDGPPPPPSPYRSTTELDVSESREYDAMLGTQTVSSVHHRSPMLTGSVRKTAAAYYSGPPSSSSNGSTPIKNGYSNGHTNGVSHFASSTTNGQPITRIAVAANSRNSPRLSAPLPAPIIPNGNHSNGGSSVNGSNSQRSSVASYSSHVSGYGSSSTPTANGASPTRNRRSPQSQKSASPISEDAIVVVRMKPDAGGRFGFNVKGGADQNYPVIVSRVAPGSSADKCYPRLNEGDQVLLINGRDVSAYSHDQVVAFIRSARSLPGGGELALTIRPNVYRLGGEDDDTSTSAALPPPAADSVPESVPKSDRLALSLRMIEDSLASGRCLSQFEALHRKNSLLTMNDCISAANIGKNRYRDVCPYDATRVHLLNSTSGDYINASYVNMDIPASGIVNRYIACQGPLAHTTPDFWQMVWEQLCTTIVMLTTTVERGRVKCHQYWPRLNETAEYGKNGHLVLKCIKERETAQCAYREFSLRDRNTGEERRVTQMQYTAWPDHGVPDDPSQFIDFVSEVRRARAGSFDPIVVHCSAGIGRTGVLILMETASCLVEANEPVYPIDIVRTMRDQRAMLIQTSGQFTFVCESILRAFNDGVIRPLAEYSTGTAKR